MTMRLFLKALLVIWPFLKSAIFKERSVAEVLKENLHLTAMLLLIVILASALIMTTTTLSEYKDRFTKLQLAVKEQGADCLGDENTKRRKRLIELLNEEL